MFLNKIHFESIDSTNQYLKDHFKELNDFTFVSSDIQTAGRGRNNRKWMSNKGNLMFSLLIKDSFLISSFKQLSIISAYTVLQVLDEYGASNISIKWPNDVYVDGKKICGILLEAVSYNQIECLIIGVGVNVNQDQFEGDYIRQPISLKQILNHEIDLESFKEKIYDQLIINLNKVKEGFDFYPRIVTYDYLKGKEVYATLSNKKEKVKVININPDYSLKTVINNKEIDVQTGEISFHL